MTRRIRAPDGCGETTAIKLLSGDLAIGRWGELVSIAVIDKACLGRSQSQNYTPRSLTKHRNRISQSVFIRFEA